MKALLAILAAFLMQSCYTVFCTTGPDVISNDAKTPPPPTNPVIIVEPPRRPYVPPPPMYNPATSPVNGPVAQPAQTAPSQPPRARTDTPTREPVNATPSSQKAARERGTAASTPGAASSASSQDARPRQR